MSDKEPPSRNASRLFVGLVVIALGVVALLDNFGIIRIDNVWRFWPLLLIALGFSRLLRPAGSPGRFAGFILLAIGGWFLLQNLGLWSHDLGDLWPILVVLLGARLVWGSFGRRGAMAPGDAASRVSLFAALGGADQRSSAPDFRGGDATAIMGGCKIDLRQAGIKSGEAVLDVFALWGGIEIVVPRGWDVVIAATPILGAVEDKSESKGEPGAPRLIVKGMAIMGGVEIKN